MTHARWNMSGSNLMIVFLLKQYTVLVNKNITPKKYMVWTGLKSILTLSSHIHLCSRINFLSSSVRIKVCGNFSSTPCMLHIPSAFRMVLLHAKITRTPFEKILYHLYWPFTNCSIIENVFLHRIPCVRQCTLLLYAEMQWVWVWCSRLIWK